MKSQKPKLARLSEAGNRRLVPSGKKLNFINISKSFIINQFKRPAAIPPTIRGFPRRFIMKINLKSKKTRILLSVVCVLVSLLAIGLILYSSFFYEKESVEYESEFSVKDATTNSQPEENRKALIEVPRKYSFDDVFSKEKHLSFFGVEIKGPINELDEKVKENLNLTLKRAGKEKYEYSGVLKGNEVKVSLCYACGMVYKIEVKSSKLSNSEMLSFYNDVSKRLTKEYGQPVTKQAEILSDRKVNFMSSWRKPEGNVYMKVINCKTIFPKYEVKIVFIDTPTVNALRRIKDETDFE